MKKISVFVIVLLFAAFSAHAQTAADRLKGLFGGKKAADRSAESQLDAMNKRLEEKNKPTGFMYREFSIRQNNLGGKWDKAEIVANPRFEAGYQYMKDNEFKTSLSQGTTTISGPFKEFEGRMKAACREDTKPGAKITVRLYNKNPQWTTFRDKWTAKITHRDLYFQCLAEGERIHERSL